MGPIIWLFRTLRWTPLIGQDRAGTKEESRRPFDDIATLESSVHPILPTSRCSTNGEYGTPLFAEHFPVAGSVP